MTEKIRPLRDIRRDSFDEGGRNYSLPEPEDHLPVLLIYYRCYVTYVFTGFLSDVNETTVIRSVKRIERIAAKVIHIKKNRQISLEEAGFLINDVTEQTVQCPEKKQKKYCSGKKKRHTHKVGITVCEKEKIRSVSGTHPGKVHDFSICKSGKKQTQISGCSGKGGQRLPGNTQNQKNAEIPYKKPKGGHLTGEQKAFNRSLSKKRIKVENVIREIKILKIISDIYRNRHRGHNIKMNIAAGIVNMKTEKRLLRNAA
ncbi:MAG: transposase family protein [Desulfococcaceae bacterium]